MIFFKASLRLAVAATALLVAACSPHTTATPAGAPAPRSLAITHVTLIDPARGARPDVTIVVAGERIVAVGPSATTPVPAGARVREGAGRFVVPGFWDAHVHLSQIGFASMPLFVANGITSVRDMGSTFEDVVRWKRARSTGELAPRIFAPGPKFDGKGELWGDNWIVTSPESARRAVDSLAAYGVDFIKVHGGLSRPVYDALADESKKKGLPFAGHLGSEYSALVCAEAGQRTIEHGSGMLPCSQNERHRIHAEKASLERLCAPEKDAPRILPALAQRGVWLTPTLVSWRGQTLNRAEGARLEGKTYVVPMLEKRWYGDDDAPPTALERELISKFGLLAAAAHRAGVHLLTGSDVGDPYVVPGFALHDEMQLLVEAGLPPLEALRAATLEGARAMGVADTVGSIEPGKAADMVLLEADPLVDIRHTRRIAAVVLNGRLLEKEELHGLLEPLRGPRPSDM